MQRLTYPLPRRHSVVSFVNGQFLYHTEAWSQSAALFVISGGGWFSYDADFCPGVREFALSAQDARDLILN